MAPPTSTNWDRESLLAPYWSRYPARSERAEPSVLSVGGDHVKVTDPLVVVGSVFPLPLGDFFAMADAFDSLPSAAASPEPEQPANKPAVTAASSKPPREVERIRITFKKRSKVGEKKPQSPYRAVAETTLVGVLSAPAVLMAVTEK